MAIVRILNRAYRRLSNVLDLAGTERLGRIDIDQAFAVHPLDRVVEATLARKFVFLKEINHGAGGDSTSSFLRPYEGNDWDEIREEDAGLATVPDLDDEDVWITHVGAHSSDVTSISNAYFRWLAAIPFSSQPVAFSSLLTGFIQDPGAGTGGLLVPNTGDPYLYGPRPWRYPQDELVTDLQFVLETSAINDVFVHVYALAAPRGVLSRG